MADTKTPAKTKKAAPKPATATTTDTKAEPQTETKFAGFLASKKLDRRRIVAASRKLEAFRPEDRAIKLRKRQARAAAEGGPPPEKAKPRSGRPVTGRAIDAALVGKPISGPTKTRLLKAINHLLEQKKQEAIDLKALF